MTWTSHSVLSSMAKTKSPQLRADIGRDASVDGKSLDAALLKLRRRGFIAPEGGRYILTAAGRAFLDSGARLTSGPRGPQPGKRLYKGTLRERAWHAMRIRRKFTLGEILELSAREDDRAAASNVGKYIRALVKTGFLAALASRERGIAPTSNGAKRYLVVRDAGPKAPRWLPRRGMVYDPNAQEEHAL